MEEFKGLEKVPKIMWITEGNCDVLRLEAEYYKEDFVECIKKLKSYNNDLLGNIAIDVKDGPGGWGIKASEYVKYGVPMLRGVNIIDGLLSIEECVYITEEKQRELKRSKVCKGDVLLAVRGSSGVGKSAVYSLDREANMNAAVVKLTLNQDLIDPYYLSCFFNSKFGRIQTERIANGVNQQNINLTEVKSNIIPIPSTEIQKYIGDKVRKAEDLREEAKELKEQGYFLIEELLNIKTGLEKINRDNRKHKWLKIEALNDRIDSEYYKEKYLETINHLKGLSFQYIQLKKMVLDMYTGKKTSQTENGEEVYFIQSGNISGNFLEVGEKVSVKVENYRVIEVGDLLIAKDGNTIGKMAVNFSDELAIINEHTYCIRFNEEYKKYSVYVYYLLVNDNINELLKREATGSAQKGLNQQFIDNMIIPLIDKESVEKLYEIENKRCNNIYLSKQLIQEAKKDVEDLIEGNFDMSKLNQS